MYVISKDGNSIVNMDHVTSIYIGADGCTVKADFANGKVLKSKPSPKNKGWRE